MMLSRIGEDNMVKLTIDGKTVKAKRGSTILEAAKEAGIKIPTLCYLKEINEIGFCRICIVKVEGKQDLVSSCNTPIKRGMVVCTDNEEIRLSRKATLSLLASSHRFDCWRCPKDGMCEFYDLLKQEDITFNEFGPGIGRTSEQIISEGISMDLTKCILCKRCVSVCQSIASGNVFSFNDDDSLRPVVRPKSNQSFFESGCFQCGLCIAACPTGTLFETSFINQVKAYLRDDKKKVVAQLDKKIQSALATSFGYLENTPIEETIGKTYEALRLLGFDIVTNIDHGTDLFIFAVAKELLHKQKKPLFITSCSSTPLYIQKHKPEWEKALSHVKSPHLINGALIKHKFLDPGVKVVTISSCPAQKDEISAPNIGIAQKDVDAVLTVSELVRMINQAGIDYKKLKGVQNHKTFTTNSTIYRGGILQGLANVLMETKESTELIFKTVTKTKNLPMKIEEATFKVNRQLYKFARVHGGKMIKPLSLRMKKQKYDVIELLLCQQEGTFEAHEDIKRINHITHDNTHILNNPLHNKTIANLDSETIDKLSIFEQGSHENIKEGRR